MPSYRRSDRRDISSVVREDTCSDGENELGLAKCDMRLENG
jgi:hypothetical protein